MSIRKVLIIGSISIFGLILAISFFKKSKNELVAKPQAIQEIVLKDVEKKEVEEPKAEEPVVKETEQATSLKEELKVEIKDDSLPEKDQVDMLFVLDSSKLPLVETITYSSRVPWLVGRPAWIADYASHYETTRHFIARGLNKKIDYFTQKVSPGDRFNVLKKEVSFYLLIDLSRAKMWFYGLDGKTNKRYLLKSYKVGLGRKDSKKSSGYLTPTGKFSLGSKVAIYKPGTMGYFQDRQIEMIRVFGTRWIPFENEVENCSEKAKGYGIHGSPWTVSQDGKLIEDREKIGKYESDGCIRLFSEDIEEIFSIVISKPTVVEIVNDFHDAKLPGDE